MRISALLYLPNHDTNREPTIMKISALTDKILTKQFNSGRPLCLRGGTGVSKTARIIAYAKKMELGLVIENLTSSEGPDAKGFLIPTKTSEGPVSMYSKPDWLRRIEAQIAEGNTQGILMLDEWLSTDHLVQKAFAPLLSEGRVGDWEIPEGWVVWATGNRVSDKAGANRMLAHVGNRMCVVDVTPDLDPWTKWAIENGIHALYIAYAQARPGVVFNDSPTKNPEEQQMTPRSFEYCHDFHTGGAVSKDLKLDMDDATQSMIAGYIGAPAMADLFAFLRTVDELPTIQEILADPLGAKLPSMGRLDAQFAAVGMVIHHADAENIDPLFTYVCRLNKEVQASAAKQLIDKTKGSLLNSRALGKWISENPALIAATFN